MYFFLKKIHPKATLLVVLLAIALAACQAGNPVRNDQAPTQDVGEEPPTRLSSSTPAMPDRSTPTATATQVSVEAPDATLVGPTPYPTPSGKIVPWNQLINRSLIGDVIWETFRSQMQGNDKSTRWTYLFSYPSGWYADTKASPIQAYIQNIPPANDPPPAEFIKFEIVRLTDHPMIAEGNVLDPKDLKTVAMAGEPGILYTVTRRPDQDRQVMVIFQHQEGWLVASGYINLRAADAAAMERFSAIILEILSSFQFTDQAGFPQGTSTPLPAIQKKPADSDYPASGICASSPENFVLINIVPGNMPDPRCVKVSASQRLQFKNETGAPVRIQLGLIDVTIQSGESEAFDIPCGDYLEPGVHHAILSAGSIPEIWLTND